MFKNTSIRFRLVVLSSALIVFLIVVSTIAVFSLDRAKRLNTDAFQENVLPLQTLSDVRVDYIDLRRLVTNMAAYFFMGNQDLMNAALESTEAKLPEVRESIISHTSRLEENASVHQGEISDMQRVLSIYDEYIASVQKQISAMKQGDGDTMTVQAGVNSEISGRLDALLNPMMDNYVEFARDANDFISDIADNMTVAVIAIAGAAIVIGVLLSYLIASGIIKSLARLRSAAISMAQGDFSVQIGSNSKDEVGALSRSLDEVKLSVQNLADGIAKVSEDFLGGEMESKVDTSNLQGMYKEVADGMNKRTADIVGDINGFVKAVSLFSDGDFSAKIPDLPGGRAVISHSLSGLRDNLSSVTLEITNLVKYASAGDLETRIDVDKYTGDWSNLMSELNRLMTVIHEPTAEVADVMSYVSRGDFSRKMEGAYKGEFMKIKDSVNTTIEAVASYIEEISSVLRGLADNNLDQGITREYTGAFSSIKDALNNIFSTLNDIVGNVVSSAAQVSIGAKSISESAISLASGSAVQTASVEQLNAVILAINASTANNAQAAKDAEKFSENSQQSAARGDSDMSNMLVSMESIKESSAKITNIIKIIDEIAFQTNLLALNASIEAAHAGIHGAGFSIVADEVKNLAAKSQNAAHETSALIEESIERVNEGERIAKETASELRQIIEDIGKVGSIISNISTASIEQENAISEVSRELNQITDVVSNASSSTQEVAAASEELSSQADIMQGIMEIFKLK